MQFCCYSAQCLQRLTTTLCRHRQLQLHYDDVGDEVLAAALAHMPCLQVIVLICSDLWIWQFVLSAVCQCDTDNKCAASCATHN